MQENSFLDSRENKVRIQKTVATAKNGGVGGGEKNAGVLIDKKYK